MAKMKSIIFKMRWWILAVTSLIIFSIMAFLAVAVSLVEPNPQVVQTPIPQTSPVLVRIYTDTPETTLPPKATSTMQIITATATSMTPIREMGYVEQVIDGDSIKVVIDGVVHELRYIGIDAPEVGMPYSEESTAANQLLVESQVVELEGDITNRDSYGRLLRYVFLLDGRFVNAELVRLGMAAAEEYPPDVKYQAVISKSEQEAIEAGIGLWEPVSTSTQEVNQEPVVSIQIDPSCSQFNAPGNDNQNKNEEYVCLINSAPKSIALQGWVIHDEYGWSYEFPIFNLESNARVRVLTGCGVDTSSELYWCKDETAIWNNDGDCVTVLDGDGNEVVKFCY
jgi:endonuclease YncB( thermonuclease family)